MTPRATLVLCLAVAGCDQQPSKLDGLPDGAYSDWDVRH
jgi:hypothetical protein